jgi:hypothetical protein
LAILSLGHSEVVPMGQKRDSFQCAVLRTGFAAMTEHVEAQRDVPAFLDRQPVRWLHLALALTLLRGLSGLALGACPPLKVAASSEAPMALVLSSIAFMLVAALFVPTLTIYGAELLPTRLARGAWAFNRLGARLAPLALTPLLRTVQRQCVTPWRQRWP